MLFITGFSQVFLVVLNTYFISKGYFTGVCICSFLISWMWSHNVKKIAFSNEKQRLIYSLGAMAGSIAAYFVGNFIYEK